MNVAMFKKPIVDCTKRELEALEKFAEGEINEWEGFRTLLYKEIERRETKQKAKAKSKTV